jgi:hypothetical protein
MPMKHIVRASIVVDEDTAVVFVKACSPSV